MIETSWHKKLTKLKSVLKSLNSAWTELSYSIDYSMEESASNYISSAEYEIEDAIEVLDILIAETTDIIDHLNNNSSEIPGTWDFNKASPSHLNLNDTNWSK